MIPKCAPLIRGLALLEEIRYMHYEARKNWKFLKENNIHKVVVVQTYTTNGRKKLILLQ